MNSCYHENSAFMGYNTKGNAVYICKDCGKVHTKEMSQVWKFGAKIDRRRWFEDWEYREKIIKRLDKMIRGGVKVIQRG